MSNRFNRTKSLVNILIAMTILWTGNVCVSAAFGQNNVLYPADGQKKPSCGEDKCQKPIDCVNGYLKTIRDIEEKTHQFMKSKRNYGRMKNDNKNK